MACNRLAPWHLDVSGWSRFLSLSSYIMFFAMTDHHHSALSDRHTFRKVEIDNVGPHTGIASWMSWPTLWVSDWPQHHGIEVGWHIIFDWVGVGWILSILIRNVVMKRSKRHPKMQSRISTDTVTLQRDARIGALPDGSVAVYSTTRGTVVLHSLQR